MAFVNVEREIGSRWGRNGRCIFGMLLVAKFKGGENTEIPPLDKKLTEIQKKWSRWRKRVSALVEIQGCRNTTSCLQRFFPSTVSNNHLLMPHGSPQSFFSGKKSSKLKFPGKIKVGQICLTFKSEYPYEEAWLDFWPPDPRALETAPGGGWNRVQSFFYQSNAMEEACFTISLFGFT